MESQLTPLHAVYHIHVHATNTARAYDLPAVPAERLQRNINRLQGAGLDIEVRGGGVLAPAATTRKTVEAWVDTPKKVKPRRLKPVVVEIEPKPVKVKAGKTGRVRITNEDKAKPIVCLTNKTYYPSCRHAAEVLGISKTSLGDHLNGKRKKQKGISGYSFRFAMPPEIASKDYIPLREQ